MSIIDRTDKAQTATLRFEVELRHPPQKVWRALTDPALLAEWLLPAIGFDLQPGTAFTLKTQPYPGGDGTVQCKLLEVEPHTKLSYTWLVGDLLDTVVTFTLAPTASGTRLSIVQSGFAPEQKDNFGGARYGWRLMAGKLVELLERTP